MALKSILMIVYSNLLFRAISGPVDLCRARSFLISGAKVYHQPESLSSVASKIIPINYEEGDEIQFL